MMMVYLAPHEYVKTEGLEDEVAKDNLLAVQRAALTLLLPTEGDTFAGMLRALSVSLKETVGLKRAIAGLAKTSGQKSLENDDPALAPVRDFAAMASADLRIVRAGQMLLSGEVIKDREPPVPPPPDSLDDLRRVPDPTDDETPKQD
jgi:hypothetical protein